MNKCDRVIYADDAAKYTLESICYFEMAYDCPDKRLEYTDLSILRFKAARRLCLIMASQNVISIGKESQHIKEEMFDRIGKIDKQLSAWRSSVVRVRPAQEGNGQTDKD